MQQDFKGQYSKVKGQSVSHHDVAHLKPSSNVPTKYKLPTTYSLWDIAWTKFYRSSSYGKVKRQIKVTPWRCTPTTPNQCPHQVSASYTLQFPKYSPDKILQVKVTTAKVKSRSHDVAHLHPLTNVPTKYQLPTPYSCWDIAQTRFYRSRSLQQGQRSNQGQTMMLHTYNS